ncbi:SDR family NAD(P)-dependent oxidoreductase [Ancylobacter vacuolatus]|uniref:NAD(P)-dependent dehydrogenase (Short-subunit alcohol dehydrogenase family) n=1 Tax=Ancylobacter vacuolatus TaxID=223389 RepID=A0ABU0DK89_9HYPH|nr:SDR family oxidoreductase [Ancylobacter vacuolatus]MDQ0348837.1 NAD(P)-dependent dehydrogenase (short-subunit alcohol dehydrogenase family) [Ancylobacter vacuolatus]
MKIDLSGSTAGIGFAIAEGLRDAGADIAINGRTQDNVDSALARLGGAARRLAMDLGTPEGARDLVAAAPSFDMAVNNLGIFQPSDFFDTTDDIWERHWQINVMTGVRMARAYLPGVAERGWGRMLFLGSESAFNIPVDMIHYGVSKTADVSLARGLAKRVAGTGVTVNSILPGPTLSEGVAAMLKAEVTAGKTLEQAGADFVKAHRPTSIIGRPATVDEVANLVVYLASPLASATTGAALRVDGSVIDSIM